jgi:hypothetical protein
MFIVGLVISVLASFFQIFGYLVYIRKITDGVIRPNAASWSIWTFGAVLESYSYIVVTGDWVKNLLPVTCTVLAIVLFIFCLSRGHFFRPTKLEFGIVVMDCIAILVWWYFSSALYANLLLIVTAIVSFLPIMHNTFVDPESENATPWFLWTVAYGLLGLVVLIRWEKWEDLIYPLAFFLLHLIVGIMSVDRKKPKFVRV